MSNRKKRKIYTSLTNGPLSRSIWRLAIPMMIGAFLQNLFTLADLFFVGKLGYIAVAAISIADVILGFLIMVVMGVSSGATVLISHFIGKQEYENADSVLFQIIIISIFCAGAMICIGLFGTTWLLRLSGATPAIIPVALEYLKISFLWSIFIFLLIGLSQALRGSGEAVFPLKVLIFSNLLNVALDPIFIFGWGFIPRMEVAGSAIATIISEAVGVSLLLWHLLFGHSTLHFKKAVSRINIAVISRIFKIGIFSSIEIFLRQVSILLLLYLVTSYGETYIAAFGIVTRLRLSVVMLGLGMGSACSVLIGQNMGAGRPERATQTAKLTLRYYEYMVIPLSVFFFIFSKSIISAFNVNPQVVETGSTFLKFIAVTLPFLPPALIFGLGVAGAGDTIAPAAMTGIFQLGLRISIAYILSIIIQLGTNGLWLGMNVSDICQGLAMFWYFNRGYWKKRYYQHRDAIEEENIALIKS
ncbi:MAG: MATE family efflux transporter [Candidatus Omnitrophica bacterium]|nr:MATE family efflux transporter [Candidatus Omnitrophota bacterium]